MFSRILSSAKNLLASTSPPESQDQDQNQDFVFDEAVEKEDMVATRRSGKGGEESPIVKPVPVLRKRKSGGISRDEEDEVVEIEEPDFTSSAKRRRIAKATPKKKIEKDLEIRPKSTVCVVEIPAMSPVPATDLSASEPEGEDVEREKEKEVIVIEDEEIEKEPKIIEEPVVAVKVSMEETTEVTTTEPIPETEQLPAQRPSDPETANKLPSPKKTSPVEESQTLDHLPPSKPQQVQHKSSLPALLPDDYLNDTPSNQVSFPKPALPLVKPKKTKFLDIVDETPKDVRIGSTTYKVAQKTSMNLAPKSLNKARLTKESWMQGRTGTKLGNGRRPVGKGFFVK
ncbi:hypothetical protein HYFRA_00000492 [Hymenoscyphus fraxineus]|uniref:Uncharacterized protein n=1 Tax=Hymenoscyphus fraxineus TaxID=746836 RepID=A0A9N9PLA9_9HELO|nr:hypothetical protein HYFRA_00000492 [Hymenoscyphus fraxineus]